MNNLSKIGYLWSNVSITMTFEIKYRTCHSYSLVDSQYALSGVYRSRLHDQAFIVYSSISKLIDTD